MHALSIGDRHGSNVCGCFCWIGVVRTSKCYHCCMLARVSVSKALTILTMCMCAVGVEEGATTTTRLQHTLALGRSHTVRSLPALSTFTGLAALSDWQPSLRTRAATRRATGPRAHRGDQPAALGLWLAVSDSPLAASRSFELRAPGTDSAARNFPASLGFRFVSVVWLAIRKFRDACWPLSWKS